MDPNNHVLYDPCSLIQAQEESYHSKAWPVWIHQNPAPTLFGSGRTFYLGRYQAFFLECIDTRWRGPARKSCYLPFPGCLFGLDYPNHFHNAEIQKDTSGRETYPNRRHRCLATAFGPDNFRHPISLLDKRCVFHPIRERLRLPRHGRFGGTRNCRHVCGCRSCCASGQTAAVAYVFKTNAS